MGLYRFRRSLGQCVCGLRTVLGVSMRLKGHRLLGRVMLGILASVIAIVVVIVVAFNVSPWPGALVFRRAFESSAVEKPTGYATMRSRTKVVGNLSYPSKFGRNDFDLYLPKQRSQSLPVIVWVHGGGFIAGDKQGVSTYATMLASRGYAVAAMNYDYAPDATYPTPVIQVGELITHLYEIAGRYGLDADRIVIGGDSAGAQIAAQFAAIETTPGYSQKSRIPAISLRRPLKAALLFCGPYDVSRLTSVGNSWIARQFVQTVGWSYLGHKDWQSTQAAKMASVVDYVSSGFPRAYIVDGNYFSFPTHARELYGRLRNDGVDATLSLYPNKPKLPHEFQFDFSHPESYDVWNKTLKFLGQ